jgi:bifunctional UDP-N-acetylglucosamine pyrophosphorylase/glucosamine-1-phosphate N-acetyltransferase/UDP-N-acetylglucosamine pyrophosphorylase
MSDSLAIVLAAGKGTRMKSELPKVLVEVGGRPMIEYVLDALRAGGVTRILVVVGYRSELVREALAGQEGIGFVEQTEQLGTGHAVMVCKEQLADYRGPVLIVTGDSPLTQSDSIRALLDFYREQQPACIIGSTYKDNPTGLGRIVRDAWGKFTAIVEEKDASDAQRAITEVNMSTYVFDTPQLLAALDQLTTGNAQGEYYITDCPGILQGRDHDVRALDVLKPCEALSVNSLDDLKAVEAELQRLKVEG